MKKIGILAIGTGGGGIHQYIQSMLDALIPGVSEGIVVFGEVVGHYDYPSGVEFRLLKKGQVGVVNRIVRFIQLLFLIRRPYFIDAIERAMFSDIEIFVCPAVYTYPHYYLGVPFIFTLHDMQERYYPENFSLEERFGRWLVNRAMAKSAAGILCESQWVADDIEKFLKIKKSKIHVIPSPPAGAYKSFEYKLDVADHTKLRLSLPNSYIFYPAQYWPHKNHIKLLKAFALLGDEYENVRLVLSGSKNNSYDLVLKTIVELGLVSKVIHLGYVDSADLPYIYKMSEFLVMPTLFESVSIPVYEAFCLGVPVCCSNAVALPEQVGDAGLLFNANSVEDIYVKIKMYLDNPELRHEMGMRGFERISSFSHADYARNIFEAATSTLQVGV